MPVSAQDLISMGRFGQYREIMDFGECLKRFDEIIIRSPAKREPRRCRVAVTKWSSMEFRTDVVELEFRKVVNIPVWAVVHVRLFANVDSLVVEINP